MTSKRAGNRRRSTQPVEAASPSAAVWSRRRGAIAAAVVSLISLCVYLATLAPTVLGDDSAELTTATHVLGICHPTGYPLYLLLARLFDLVPVGTHGARIGLFSAICGSAAAGAIAWTTAELTVSVLAGMLAGLVAAFNGPMWSKATEPEVYALNALIISLALVAFVRGNGRPRPSRTVWLAFLAGLGLAHHRTSVFFIPPLLAAAILRDRPGKRALAKALAAFVAPLALYLYLPIRALSHPPLMWSDVSRWDEFVAYISGGAYQHYVFGRSPHEMLEVTGQLLSRATSELTIGGTALALIGAPALLRRDRSLGLALVIGVASLTAWSLGYAVSDWSDFLVPCALAAGVWAGMAVTALSRALDWAFGKRVPLASAALALGALVLVPASLIQQNWSTSGHRGDWRDYDKARAVFAQIPPNAVYVSNSDFAIYLPMYLQIVEGERRDILVTGPSPVYTPWAWDADVTPIIETLRAGWETEATPGPEGASREALKFAAALAERLGPARAIYCGAYVPSYPVGMRAVALWADFFRVGEEPHGLIVAEPKRSPVATYEKGISLVEARVDPGAVRPRELFRIRLDWGCAQAIQTPPYVLMSLARELPTGKLARPQQMLTQYDAWLASGAAPLAPSPAGFAYRQEVVGITPTNAPPGRWWLLVGVADGSGEAIPMKPVARFRIMPADVSTPKV